MKLNLRSQIKSDIYLIVEEFKNHGWKNINDDLIQKKSAMNFHSLDGLNMVIFPIILHYSESQIWYACSFELPEPLIKEAIDYFLDLFTVFKYKPFKDQDAKASHFIHYTFKDKTKKSFFDKIIFKSQKYIKTVFFLNPDYPNGYWTNHTIDSIHL